MEGEAVYVVVPDDVKNLTGTKRGNVNILGYLGNGKWQGKCICGRLVTRDGKSWRNGLNKGKIDQGCDFCAKNINPENLKKDIKKQDIPKPKVRFRRKRLQ
jgi:hypothetical protein